MKKPWEQKDGEPDASYIRFLFYRNLGPCRTLLAAYRQFMSDLGEEWDGKEKQYVPGQWTKDASAWEWLDRCRSWDKVMLATHGGDAVVAFVDGIRSLARRFAAVARDHAGPESWDQLMESANVLGSFITPESIKSVHDGADSGASDEQERDGDAEVPEQAG